MARSAIARYSGDVTWPQDLPGGPLELAGQLERQEERRLADPEIDRTAALLLEPAPHAGVGVLGESGVVSAAQLGVHAATLEDIEPPLDDVHPVAHHLLAVHPDVEVGGRRSRCGWSRPSRRRCAGRRGGRRRCARRGSSRPGGCCRARLRPRCWCRGRTRPPGRSSRRSRCRRGTRRAARGWRSRGRRCGCRGSRWSAACARRSPYLRQR